LDFTYSYCNNLNKQRSLFYNDDYRRTTKINMDLKPSLEYFYPEVAIKKMTEQFGKVNLDSNPFEPVLVFEKYFYGIGCKSLKNPLDHLNELTSNSSLRKMSIGALITQCLIQLILIIYIFLKLKGNNKAVSFCIFLIMGLVGVTIFLSFTAMLSGRSTFTYFNGYDFWCQNNFRGNRVESGLERGFKNNIALAALLHFAMFCAQVIAGVFLVLGFFNNCCCKPKDDDEEVSGGTKSGLEMKMNSTIHRH
jgi:hypothetical protein